MDPNLLLLRRYVQGKDQDTFETLVSRHIDLVYAAAMRQVRNSHAAEEVTQDVFVLLARKARKIGDGVLLGGWLVNATRLIARQHLRAAARRAKHEREAAVIRQQQSAPQLDLNDFLDEALGRLDQTSRGVLVMQYLQGRDSADIAASLGITQEAARKRVSRALAKLREIFASRGIATSTEALAISLAASRRSAPAQLAQSAAAASIGKSAAAVTTFFSIKTIVAAVAVLTASVVTVAILQPPATQAANQIEGIVYTSDGAPAADAAVYLSTAAKSFSPYTRGRRPGSSIVTSGDGRFSISSPLNQDFVLMSIDDRGYAELSSKAIQKNSGKADMMIQPWARIEGVAMIGSKPAAGAHISLWNHGDSGDIRDSLAGFNDSAVADARGRFVFPRVTPGQTWLALERQPDGRYHFDYRVLEAGKAVQWTLGGVGRPLVGHAITAGEPFVWRNDKGYRNEVTIKRQLPIDPALQQLDPTKTPEENDVQQIQIGRTETGRLYKLEHYPVTGVIDAAGNFRFEDIESGDYQVQITNFQNLPEVHSDETVVRKELSITVPPMQTPQSDEPFDVGAVEVTPEKRLIPGQPAPQVVTSTLDGRPWSLAEQKGKVVLIFVWSPADMEHARQFAPVINELVKQNRVVTLGIVNDGSAEKVRQAITEMKMDWPQTMWSEQVRDVNTWVSSAVLIDSEGRVVMHRMTTIKQLETFLAKAEQKK